MEYFKNYLTKMEMEGTGPELLNELRQEAICSLQADLPEQALTLTGQMVSALLLVAKRQKPLEQSMINVINELTAMMIDYLERLGWHQRAVKTEAGWIYERLPPSRQAERVP